MLNPKLLQVGSCGSNKWENFWPQYLWDSTCRKFQRLSSCLSKFIDRSVIHQNEVVSKYYMMATLLLRNMLLQLKFGSNYSGHEVRHFRPNFWSTLTPTISDSFQSILIPVNMWRILRIQSSEVLHLGTQFDTMRRSLLSRNNKNSTRARTFVCDHCDEHSTDMNTSKPVLPHQHERPQAVA